MPDPTPERIAAALALAEAVDAAARACDLDGTPTELFQRTFLARCEALAAYRATTPKPSKVYDWSRVPAALWAALAHECCADDRWENMRPELIAAVQAVQAAADEKPTAKPAPETLRTLADVDAEIGLRVRSLSPEMLRRAGYATLAELAAEPTAEPEPERGNPLVRITWQCGSCGWGYFGSLQEVCPGCGAAGFWSGSVAPDCKPWPGYHCAPAPGVKATPLPTPERVQLLEELAEGLVDMLDGEPSGTDSLDWALERYGYKPTKGVTEAELEVANDADASASPEAFTSELVRSLQEGNKFLQDQLVAANAARRLRLAEIYHLTITYGDDPAMALLAIRNASGPGA